jgi:lactate dehydrogenase-like 2-hydroxyacid dehydrogenase
LIGAEQLAMMKRTAVLVNIARGGIVDDAALVQALRDGVIFSAGLDVYENEPALHPGLLKLSNVVLAPHLGSATLSARQAMANLAADNLVAWVTGSALPSPVKT